MTDQDPEAAIALAKQILQMINVSGHTEEEALAALTIVQTLIPLLEMESNHCTYIGGPRQRKTEG